MIDDRKSLLKALKEAKKILTFVANCAQCGRCKSQAANCLGYEVNPVLNDELVARAKRRKPRRKKKAAAPGEVKNAD